MKNQNRDHRNANVKSHEAQLASATAVTADAQSPSPIIKEIRKQLVGLSRDEALRLADIYDKWVKEIHRIFPTNRVAKPLTISEEDALSMRDESRHVFDANPDFKDLTIAQKLRTGKILRMWGEQIQKYAMSQLPEITIPSITN